MKKSHVRTTRALAGFVLLLFAVAALAQSAPADLDQWVARSMKEFDVPGIAVAIVKDGKVVVAKGYGVRKLGDPKPVNEHTLFGIASNSKAFTTAALAMLVDEGKLAWDDPVTKYLPQFHLYDPYVTRELTVRDLVSHRSGLGLGAGDLLFWPDTDVTRDQVVTATRYIRPASSLRSKYAYNNLMFVVAGQLIPAVTGKSWDDFVRERIFKPLDMSTTTITSIGFKPGDNVAVPHSRGWRLEGELTPIAMTRDNTWAAAAGIKSNVADLSKWLIAQLDHGKLPDGRRLWSEKQSEEMWSPATIIPVSEPPAPLQSTKANFAAYGLGWSLRDYRGHKVISHGGALTGMVSTVLMVPDQKPGIVILTNQEESGAFSSLAYHILDSYLQLPPTDWIAAYRQVREDTLKKAADKEQRFAAARARDTHPSLDPAKYAGEYEDTWYGKAVIERQNGKLVLRMSRTPSMVADLKHWQYDTFKATFRDKTIPDAFVTFELKYDGSIIEMKMTPVSDLADFSFDYDDLRFRPLAKKTGEAAK